MQKDMPLLKLKNVSKFYYNKGMVASGFSRVNLEFNMGEFVVITGESGSGKSTLLNVLSGLDTYEEGEMYINGEETSHYNESDFEEYRKTYIGNIFQSFNLVNSYTVYQNIELVLLLNGYKKKDVHEKIIKLIKDVDLYRFRNTRVSRLSGGQKQRVAIARALAKDTPIIIADEPTGNLDSKSAKSVLKLLKEIAREKLVVLVTHNYDQVQEYATRKIEMHDGKVREDLVIKDYQKTDANLLEFNDIGLGSKTRLGFRNTFNIFSKFSLTFIVFLFVVLAFLGEYASFQQFDYMENQFILSDYFTKVDDTRLIISKKDGSHLTDNDFDKITSIDHVVSLEKNDVLLDQSAFFLQNDDYYYFWGNIHDAANLKSVDIGRLPEQENEIVVAGSAIDYSISEDPELFTQKFYLSNSSGVPITDSDLKVVGVVLHDNLNLNYEMYLYHDKYLKMLDYAYDSYADTTITINNNKITLDIYSGLLYPVAHPNVKDGEVIISSNSNYLCKYGYCKNQILNIHTKNVYYEESLNLKIVNMYDKNNFKKLFDMSMPEYADGQIYLSVNDFHKLYNQNIYQSSIFVDKHLSVEEVAQKLDELGFKAFLMRDIEMQEGKEITAILRIFKLIVTIILFIVLFFIAYFVIRLIQKSKNVYYSTIRILGGSKNVISDLIKIELLVIFHFAFLITLLFIWFVNMDLIANDYLQNLCDYLVFKDYVIIYLILLAMSLLIGRRYSRKLFKSSAMKAYREEA